MPTGSIVDMLGQGPFQPFFGHTMSMVNGESLEISQLMIMTVTAMCLGQHGAIGLCGGPMVYLQSILLLQWC